MLICFCKEQIRTSHFESEDFNYHVDHHDDYNYDDVSDDNFSDDCIGCNMRPQWRRLPHQMKPVNMNLPSGFQTNKSALPSFARF